MNYNQDVFRHQYPIVDRFVVHLSYYRALDTAGTARQLHNQFWALTTDAHLHLAALYWCMVFGSDGCNPTHWKQLSSNESDELAQSFRDGLFQELQLDKIGWDSYWNTVKEFRDNWVAHRKLDFCRPVPNFDTALSIAYYYDNG